jgi:hypothetical protein
MMSGEIVGASRTMKRRFSTVAVSLPFIKTKRERERERKKNEEENTTTTTVTRTRTTTRTYHPR